MERIHAYIDTKALRHNFTEARRLAPTSRIMSVVKSNGYGHGLCEVAACLAESDAFAVATMEEGVALRAVGVRCPVVLLSGFFHSSQVDALLAQQIEPVIHHAAQINMLKVASPRNPADAKHARLNVWFKVDSGMHRFGFALEEVESALAKLRALKIIAEVRLMTHFSAADDHASDVTQQQLRAYDELRALPYQHSLANSAAIIAYPPSHAEWVRPGLMLYGASPLKNKSARTLHLRPAMTLRAVLLSVRVAKKGQGIGYGPVWHCPESMPIGIVACGYGDGYPRLTVACNEAGGDGGTSDASQTGDALVCINGRIANVIGAVSMDSLTVDLRSVPNAKPGDVVELWGEQIPVNTVAEAAHTIPHQVLCNVAARVPRTY